MKFLFAPVLSVAVAAGAILPAMTSDAEARRGRGAAIAAGVALGVLGAAALSSRAHADVEHDEEWRYRCNRWADQCEDGYRRACYRYENRCLD